MPQKNNKTRKKRQENGNFDRLSVETTGQFYKIKIVPQMLRFLAENALFIFHIINDAKQSVSFRARLPHFETGDAGIVCVLTNNT